MPLLPRPVRGGDGAGAGLAARVGQVAHVVCAQQAARAAGARGAEQVLRWLAGPGGRARWSPSCGAAGRALAVPPASDLTVAVRQRVVSLIYRRTPHGLVRMDEFAGHLDQIVFEKFVHLGNVTEVEVNGTRGLWVTGPQELV